MPTNKKNFTDARLLKLEHDGSKKRLILFDAKQPGLALQLTPAGSKTFQFRHWDAARKKTQILTIGKYPKVALSQAREKAATLLTNLNAGIDIVENSQQIQQESTLNDLFSTWLVQFAKPHKKTWDEDERRYNLYLKKPLGGKRLSWFNPTKIRQWHQGITKLQKQRGPKGVTISHTTANRALALISTVFNQAAPDITNPCIGVKKFKETSRDRFLRPDELKRFFTALEDPQTPQNLKDYLFLSLFTGARRSNILSMRWKDIDLSRLIWTIPAQESKNGKAMQVPLVEQSLEILTRRRKTAHSMFVLPSPASNSGHLEEPKKSWQTLLKRADLSNVRLHDLRRTMGSYMAISGANLPSISKALGHQNQTTTAVYARMDLDPVRAGMERAAAAMLSTRDLPEKVVSIVRE